LYRAIFAKLEAGLREKFRKNKELEYGSDAIIAVDALGFVED